MGATMVEQLCAEIDEWWSKSEVLAVADLVTGSRSLRSLVVRNLTCQGLLEKRPGSVGRWIRAYDNVGAGLADRVRSGELQGLCQQSSGSKHKRKQVKLPEASVEAPVEQKPVTVADQLIEVVDLFATKVPEAIEKLVDLFAETVENQLERAVRQCEIQASEVQNLRTLLEMGRSELRKKDSKISELLGRINRLQTQKNAVITEEKVVFRDPINSRHSGGSRG